MQPGIVLQQPKSSSNCKPYRQLLGALLFLSRVSRPDISFAVSKLYRFMSNYDDTHWQAAKTVLRYLIGTTTRGILLSRSNDLLLSGYSDSDFASDCLDRKSITGYVYFLGSTPITWSSQKQPIVSTSSTEAEYIALADASRECLWLRAFLSDLQHPPPNSTTIFVDNKSAIDLSHNSQFHRRTKHIDVRYHFTCHLVSTSQISINHVSTEQETADILTKPLGKSKHEAMVSLLNLQDAPLTSTSSASKKPSCDFSSLKSTVLLLLFMLTISSTSCFTAHNQPVLWRNGKTPVTNGHAQIHLQIKFVSPCNYLTKEVIHTDLLQHAQTLCNDYYIDLFLNPLTQMCPPEPRLDAPLSRPKRFISLLASVIIISIVACIGVSATATTIAVQDNTKINAQSKLIAAQTAANKQLIDAHNKFLQDFKVLANKFQNHTQDFYELKSKTIETSFVSSHIVCHLNNFNVILKHTYREWKQHRLYPPFLDYFNVTLNCTDNCPLQYAKPRRCGLTTTRDTLHMDFNLPIVNSSLHVITADPFTFFHKVNGKTCKMTYTGPTSAIYDSIQDCVYPANVYHSDIVLTPSGPCHRDSSPLIDKYFSVSKCSDSFPSDVLDFIQIKRHGNTYYIYCYMNNFTIAGTTQPCPNHVFSINFGITFAINGRLVKAGEFIVDHQEVLDPTITDRASWHLQPRLNIDDLINKINDLPEVHPDIPWTETIIQSHWFSSITTLLAFIHILLLIYSIYRCCSKSTSAPAPQQNPLPLLEGENQKVHYLSNRPMPLMIKDSPHATPNNEPTCIISFTD